MSNAMKRFDPQAISYTTGVPAMIGALMILTGKWRGKGVFNMEEFDPAPFMDALNRYGLPWTGTNNMMILKAGIDGRPIGDYFIVKLL